jgi:hypothetical protein
MGAICFNLINMLMFLGEKRAITVATPLYSIYRSGRTNPCYHDLLLRFTEGRI